jgi:tRNA nucleotidyltransferase (CCA-adding enzyme)
MGTNEYLQKLLESQDLADDSQEMTTLRDRRKEIEALLRKTFPDASPTIRYGGSKAKGTLIKEAYDLDLIFYPPHDDISAGETLKDIYENAREALEKEYSVVPKTSALRVRSRQSEDLHIDVVPGRYTDDKKADCFIYQASAEKCRLKTNLDTQITHVKDSGVVDAIRLLKLWKTRKALRVKQFVFELLIIKLLKGKKAKPLAEQLEHVLTQIKDAANPISVEDPANPSGNDLTSALTTTIWSELSLTASATLSVAQESGWEKVFGKTEKMDEAARSAGLQRAAVAVSVPTRPWRGIE